MDFKKVLVEMLCLILLFSCVSEHKKKKILEINNVKFRVIVDKEGQGKIDYTNYLFSLKKIENGIQYNYKSKSIYPSFTISLLKEDKGIKGYLIESDDTINFTKLQQVSIILSPDKGYKIYKLVKKTPEIMDDDETFFLSPDYGVLLIRNHYPRGLQTLIKSPLLNQDTLNYLLDAIYMRPFFWNLENK